MSSKTSINNKKTKYPKVTFIIPTLNAQEYLPNCLKAIRSQLYPINKVEIIVADGGSTDNTIEIAKYYKAITIKNPEVLHEPGKTLASNLASGEILFFTDADNQIVGKKWISTFAEAYLENKDIVGFLPQTTAPPIWNSFDRYLGYLFTDPYTWFIYRWAANPKTYFKMSKPYKPIVKTDRYSIYSFNVENHPLFGLSQGVGTLRKFKRGKTGHSDDIMAGIKLISEGGLIVYSNKCEVYHYHVRGLKDFFKKYTWRIRNNLNQKIKGMGLINRQKYLNRKRKLRELLFPFYSVSIIFPIIDSISLYRVYNDKVMFWHPIACLILSAVITKELILFALGFKISPGVYGTK